MTKEVGPYSIIDFPRSSTAAAGGGRLCQKE